MVDHEEVETGRGDPAASRATNSNNIELERSARPSNRPSRQPQSAPNATARDDEDEEELKYGAEHVIRLFVPVSICMAFVILSMKIIKFYSIDDPNLTLAYTPFRSSSDDDTSKRVMSSLGNAAIMICFIVVMTFGLILLYKFKCYRFIHGWLIMSSLMLLTMFSLNYVGQLMMAYNWCVSYPTVLFVMINYAAMGMICIHWKGPLLMQQGYLISISALMALMFIKMLPDWTVWSLLAMIVVWDLIAVLCPRGPLNMLVQMSQERNEPIFPALIYSSAAGILMLPQIMTMSIVAEGERKSEEEKEKEGDGRDRSESHSNHPSTSSSVPSGGAASTSVLIPSGESSKKRPQVRRVPPPPAPPPPSTGREERRGEEGRGAGGSRARAGGDNNTQARRVATSEEEAEERGIKLGLGDFIFYSVLVGKACEMNDWNTIVACYVAILLGLCATLLLLAVFKKALPALPISITAGLIFYFCTTLLITPFTTQLVTHQLTY